MHNLTLPWIVLVSLAQADYDETAAKRLLLPHYLREAAACEFYLDDDRQQRLCRTDRC
jgi:hypothetical protein